jgi:uncharacterized protein YjbI with pentapeptide repeats
MANQEHLEAIRQGGSTWNQWRKDNPQRADLKEADLRGMDLSQANLRDADLTHADLKGASLSRADLFQAVLGAADLTGANLVSAYLGRTFLSGARFVEADLSWSQFMEADGRLANFERANLSNAEFTDANLSQSSFKGANLNKTNFTFVTFHMADLSGADLREAILYGSDLWRTNLSGTNLQGAELRNATFVETNLNDADLSGSSVYGSSVWEIQGQPKAQLNLNIANAFSPPILVDDIEVAQFIYLLLNHQKLRKVINAVTQKGVLILGRFGNGGRELLQVIAERLREMTYLPIIFDFDRPEDRDYTETVMTLAGLSRFVIVDLSGPSTPQELYATVPHLEIPFVSIVNASAENRAHAMWVDFRKYHWFIGPPLEFRTAEEIVKMLPNKIIARAENKYQDIKMRGKADDRK